MKYDGTGKLAEAIADLCGVSVKSQAQIAELIKQAKSALGITSKAKLLPVDVKLAIYKWHYDRLTTDIGPGSLTQADMWTDDVYNVKQDISEQETQVTDNPVQNVKQVLTPDNVVQNVKQDNPVQDIKQDDDDSVYDFKQVHFALLIHRNGKPIRTTVMLEAYMVDILKRRHGLSDNTAVRQWLEQSISSDARFDCQGSLSKQARRLIVESLAKSSDSQKNITQLKLTPEQIRAASQAALAMSKKVIAKTKADKLLLIAETEQEN